MAQRLRHPGSRTNTRRPSGSSGPSLGNGSGSTAASPRQQSTSTWTSRIMCETLSSATHKTPWYGGGQWMVCTHQDQITEPYTWDHTPILVAIGSEKSGHHFVSKYFYGWQCDAGIGLLTGECAMSSKPPSTASCVTRN
jgi:hypothetical protein